MVTNESLVTTGTKLSIDRFSEAVGGAHTILSVEQVLIDRYWEELWAELSKYSRLCLHNTLELILPMVTYHYMIHISIYRNRCTY